MAKEKIFKGILGIIAFVSVVLSGCTTTSLTRLNPVGGTYQYIAVPNKDFDSKGVVLAQYTSEGDGAGSESGEVYTYYKLLEEAKKLGADTIVNVVIEAAQEAVTTKLFFFTIKQGVTKKNWFGSATAIKYTTTITETHEKSVIVLGPDGKQIITDNGVSSSTGLASSSSASLGSSGSGFKWYNPFTWFKKK